MRKSMQSKLIAFTGKDFVKPDDLPPVSNFIRKMLYYPDSKEAALIIAEQAELEFDQGQGAELEKLKHLQSDLDARFKTSKATLEMLEDKLKNTKQYIKSGLAQSGDRQGENGFLQMRAYDQMSLALLIPTLITTLIMGAANVYSNLQASGEAVFIEQPLLAIFISMLLPAGSTSLKFISNFFDYQSTKKRYALFIYTLTAIALLAWSVLFAMNFKGVASDIDWNSLGESGGDTGVFLVWIQLVAEMLVAAALFLAAEEIYLKYAPNLYTENPDYINAKKTLEVHVIRHEKLRDARGKNIADIAMLNAARKAFINERMADYMALRARFNNFNQF